MLQSEAETSQKSYGMAALNLKIGDVCLETGKHESHLSQCGKKIHRRIFGGFVDCQNTLNQELKYQYAKNLFTQIPRV